MTFGSVRPRQGTRGASPALTTRRFWPRASISEMTSASAPSPMEVITITAPTPTAVPERARAVRMRCRRRALAERRRFLAQPHWISPHHPGIPGFHLIP